MSEIKKAPEGVFFTFYYMQKNKTKSGTYPVYRTHNPYNYVTAKSPSDSTPCYYISD